MPWTEPSYFTTGELYCRTWHLLPGEKPELTPETEQKIEEAARNLAEWAKQTSCTAEELATAFANTIGAMPREIIDHLADFDIHLRDTGSRMIYGIGIALKKDNES